jgi:hypothetical protein
VLCDKHQAVSEKILKKVDQSEKYIAYGAMFAYGLRTNKQTL